MSSSLKKLDLDYNELFGIEGVRSVLPFLESSPQITILNLGSNRNINSECFELLIRALHRRHDRHLNGLFFSSCSITNISALETYTLPRLEELILSGNNIGRDGCRTISNLLHQEESTVRRLHLINAGIDDEGAEMIAHSLKHNTALKILHLSRNNITEKGYRALLSLLIDVSSIDNTYNNSNHTLMTVNTSSSDQNYDNTDSEIQSLIHEACSVNPGVNVRSSNNQEATGKAKVIKYQLNSQNRKKLCQVQEVKYLPGSLFADIETVLLPRILALIGREHGQSELYSTLIPTAPDLLSYIDRKALIDDKMAKNTAQITALTQQLSILTAENDQLSRRREMIDIGDSLAGGEGDSMKVGDKKRKVQH